MKDFEVAIEIGGEITTGIHKAEKEPQIGTLIEIEVVNENGNKFCEIGLLKEVF